MKESKERERNMNAGKRRKEGGNCEGLLKRKWVMRIEGRGKII